MAALVKYGQDKAGRFRLINGPKHCRAGGARRGRPTAHWERHGDLPGGDAGEEGRLAGIVWGTKQRLRLGSRQNERDLRGHPV